MHVMNSAFRTAPYRRRLEMIPLGVKSSCRMKTRWIFTGYRSRLAEFAAPPHSNTGSPSEFIPSTSWWDRCDKPDSVRARLTYSWTRPQCESIALLVYAHVRLLARSRLCRPLTLSLKMVMVTANRLLDDRQTMAHRGANVQQWPLKLKRSPQTRGSPRLELERVPP